MKRLLAIKFVILNLYLTLHAALAVDDQIETIEKNLRFLSKKQTGNLAIKEEQDNERNLQISVVACPGGGPVAFFNIQINLTPQGGYNTSQCTSTLRKNIGTALNTLLKNYGIGSQGVGDNAAYIARVCTTPYTTRNRRRLQVLQFVWKGGGNCRQCVSDNFDNRRRKLFSDPNWFRNIYAPELQNTLRNAITNNLVKNHVLCLGNGPRVDVYVTEVASSQVIRGC
jgi:hypothetical protein